MVCPSSHQNELVLLNLSSVKKPKKLQVRVEKTDFKASEHWTLVFWILLLMMGMATMRAETMVKMMKLHDYLHQNIEEFVKLLFHMKIIRNSSSTMASWKRS